MSLTMTKGEGVTVFTVTADPHSACPPMCQILGALCHSPVCCTVSQRMKKIQSTSQSALGALQILVGLLHIGLGAILCASGGGSWYQMDELLFPFWLGAFFIAFGITCILSEKFPSPCLVITNVILNLLGVAFAIAAIVLYCINLVNIDMWWMCRRDDDEYWYDRSETKRTTPTPEDRSMREKCEEGKHIIEMLATSVNAVLIVLSVLQLCLVISSAVLGIKALRKNGKEVTKAADDSEAYKPLLVEVTTNPTV